MNQNPDNTPPQMPKVEQRVNQIQMGLGQEMMDNQRIQRELVKEVQRVLYSPMQDLTDAKRVLVENNVDVNSPSYKKLEEVTVFLTAASNRATGYLHLKQHNVDQSLTEVIQELSNKDRRNSYEFEQLHKKIKTELVANAHQLGLEANYIADYVHLTQAGLEEIIESAPADLPKEFIELISVAKRDLTVGSQPEFRSVQTTVSDLRTNAKNQGERLVDVALDPVNGLSVDLNNAAKNLGPLVEDYDAYQLAKTEQDLQNLAQGSDQSMLERLIGQSAPEATPEVDGVEFER